MGISSVCRNYGRLLLPPVTPPRLPRSKAFGWARVLNFVPNLARRDIDDQLAELYRVTRSFESFFAHGREYRRASGSAQVPDSAH